MLFLQKKKHMVIFILENFSVSGPHLLIIITNNSFIMYYDWRIFVPFLPPLCPAWNKSRSEPYNHLGGLRYSTSFLWIFFSLIIFYVHSSQNSYWLLISRSRFQLLHLGKVYSHAVFMVRILDGISEHVAQEWKK